MVYQFDSLDVKNFLSPSVYFVGASFGGNDCQLASFIDGNFWENGYIEYTVDNPEKATSKTELYENRTDDIVKGDILVIKRLNGQGSSTMRVLAVGVVVGRNAKKQIKVAWVLPDINIQFPLVEVGTISSAYDLFKLEEAMQALIGKARTKFLRLNLEVVDRNYY